MNNPDPLLVRPRRLRGNALLREMLQRIAISPKDIICPVFVTEGSGVKREITSMHGVHQMSVDVCCDWLAKRADEGFRGFIAFGVIDRARKDAYGSHATDPNNIICALLREVTKRKITLVPMTDVCLCEYTDHGHCGPMTADNATVDNDKTLPLLAAQALNHARAGAKVIAPSGMMDGMVGAIRKGLDSGGFSDVAILAYSVKYASAFYGPFRDAAGSVPSFGDRRGHQMDPARGVEEALLEVQQDIAQGADMVMVKPAGPYLDVLQKVRAAVNVPVVAYQTSGEYAMLEAAAKNGWLEHDRAVMESLLSIKRAGADLVISYYAEQLCHMKYL